MKVYIKLHIEGNKTYNNIFIDKFYKEYKTNGEIEYDLTDSKYEKLLTLFNSVGFNKKHYYYSIGRPLRQAGNNTIYGTIELIRLHTYNNKPLNIEKLKYYDYEEYANSYIMFYNKHIKKD